MKEIKDDTNKWSSSHNQEKSQKFSTWVQPQKWQNDFHSFPKKTIQHRRIQVNAPTTDAKETEFDQFYEDPKDLLELTPRNDVLFIQYTNAYIWNLERW